MSESLWNSTEIEETEANRKKRIRDKVCELTGNDRRLEWLKIWSHEQQRAPEGDWHSWLFLGGRGAGKTRAGAEWLSAKAAKGIRLALVGPSLHDVREVMIEGESGLISVAADDNRPRYEVSRRRLIWPKGGVAYAYSAEDVESLRGPQFHYGWADEFCAWPKPLEMLAQLRLGLRLGPKPQLCLTTTPKPIRALKVLMKEPGVVMTRSDTKANEENLSADFMSSLLSLYGGTRLAAQELEGLIVEDADHALWRASDMAGFYRLRPDDFDEIVVAVDPPVTSTGDACGIIVAGRVGERAFVLEDATVSRLSPLGWASEVADRVVNYAARRVVAEANQGGEMIRTMLSMAKCAVPIELVHARIGKWARAEPVAALYEQGRVFHAPAKYGERLLALEEEMMAFGRSELRHSPDRVDALVWAVTALLISGRGEPRMRWV